MNRKQAIYTRILSLLLMGILISACALTLKQSALHMKRDWMDIREHVVVAYNEGKLDPATVVEFITADESFQEAYVKLVDKILADGDITEDEIEYLQSLIKVWRDRIP